MGFKIRGYTDAAAYQLVWRVEEALECKEYALGIFLDIELRFDNASFESIEMAMEKARLDRSVQKWNSHMLRNRKIFLELKVINKSKTVRKRCPHGRG